MSTEKSFFSNPDKRKLFIVTILSLTGIALCLTAMSNFFTESIFRGEFAMMWFLIFANVGVYLKFFFDYRKTLKR